ncbi:thioredoxin family protein [bacterium]|nr:thioredoxin family protein [bacterium]
MAKKTAVVLTGLLLAVTTVARADVLKLGEPAPSADVKMKNVDGKELSITDVKGEKGTLVIFSCNHCPYVKAWEERIAQLGNDYQKKGVGVIQINANDPAVAGDTFEAMQQRAKERGFEFPYVVDASSGVARAFGASRTPEVFLFDAAGQLVYHGTVDDNYQSPADVKERYLADALTALVAGAEIKVKEIKAIGCSIKFRKQG